MDFVAEVVTLAERLRSPSLDPVAGWTFIAAEIANTAWSEYLAVVRRLNMGPYESASYERYGMPLWALISSDLIDFLVVIIVGFGIVRARAWAFWIQAIFSLQIAFDLAVRHWKFDRLSPHSLFLFWFSVLVFVYAGLRILGVVGDGPRPLFRRAESVA